MAAYFVIAFVNEEHLKSMGQCNPIACERDLNTNHVKLQEKQYFTPVETLDAILLNQPEFGTPS